MKKFEGFVAGIPVISDTEHDPAFVSLMRDEDMELPIELQLEIERERRKLAGLV